MGSNAADCGWAWWAAASARCIGGAHRFAARLDDSFDLVSGAFSSDAERSLASAAMLGIDPRRAYGDWREMAEREAQIAPEARIDAVAIVTPNHLHCVQAQAFLEKGFHVICDKPMASRLEDAVALAETVRRTGRIFVLTHNYSGYPLTRHAREMVRNGELGDLRVIQVEYAQDWLSRPIEAEGQKQATWRVDPAQAGPGGALGDIGTHAFHLASFISGMRRRERVRRSVVLRGRSQARRQRTPAAALPGPCARHAVGQPSCGRK